MSRLVRVGGVVHRADCPRVTNPAPDAVEPARPFPIGDRLSGGQLRAAVADRGLRVCTACKPLAEGGQR